MNFGTSVRRGVTAQVLGWLGLAALAQDLPPDPLLNESIAFFRNHRALPVDLETTVFRPEGAGPFPVVVINHGKDMGNNRLQPRARYLPATREFLQRGYAVVLPMRQGFSKSGGAAVGEGCNIGGNGEAQAEDVRSAVAWIEQQPWADTSRMVMLGQSHGGLTTLAYAQNPHPGFKLFVNFAGGLRYTNNCQWEQSLKDAFERYGSRTQVPSLWFYGENDSYFPPAVVKPAFEAYRSSAAGQAELVAFGPFGRDAHFMFSSTAGVPIWWPHVQDRLEALGWPTAIAYPQYAPVKKLPVPPSTQFAPLDKVEAVPYLRVSGQDGYRLFLDKPLPRAFAIAPNGAWGWATEGDDPLQRALDSCRRHAKGECKLYAVDKAVVWIPEQ